jgi:uncharacterized membrane protein AbrB (regulator of aidB expression)
MFLVFWLAIVALLNVLDIHPAWLLLPVAAWVLLIMGWMIGLSLTPDHTDRASIIGVFAFGVFMLLLVTVAYPNSLWKWIKTNTMRAIKGLT